MIRVGFLGYESNYQGGINYLKNLFYAVKQLENPKIEIVVFVGKKDDYQAKVYGEYVRVIRTSVLDRYSLLWFINKIFYKIVKYPIILDLILRFYKINVLSHSYLTSKFFKVKILNWIPDFQILHYPELWAKKDIQKWKKLLYKLAQNSDRIVLSSNDAFKDFVSCLPKYKDKVEILQFVSQPPNLVNTLSIKELQEKYKFYTNFFYLPNQFWKHKNHKVVFEACLLLKKKGIDITVICTGLMEDFRSKDNEYVNDLLNFITENNLKNNIKTLGLIDYSNVLSLMKNSLAIINPSFFEGWSSTVEESKSMGKKIVLSNIPVHIEQSPERAYYFDPSNVLELSNILEQLWILRDEKPDSNDITLDKRTIGFAKKYSAVICDLVSEKLSTKSK
jgi:glycosyltransferase involved in cell wall biosynthesis